MNADTLLENFEILAEAPGGINRLRELILQLATNGKLLNSSARKTNPATGLPETWMLLPFNEVAQFAMGKTPPTKNPDFWGGVNSTMWVSIGDMQDGQTITESNKTVSLKAGSEVFRREPWPEGTLLMSFKLTIGKMARLGHPAFFNEAIFAFDAGNEITNEYLFRVLPLISRSANSKGAIKGNTLNSESISQMRVPVPPLNEQEGIVAKVDELMALCDQLEQQQKHRDNLRTSTRKSVIDTISTATTPEELETAWKRINNNWEVIADTPESIESLRALVFDLATYGVLVSQEKSDKAQTFAIAEGPFLIPSSWLWTTLGEISKYGGSGNVSPSEIQLTDWVLDLEDIEKGTSRLIERVTANSRPTKSNKARFKVGDVLYGKLRPYLDKVLVAESDGFCTTEIVSITPKNGIDPYWLKISLKSPRFLSYVTSKSYGMKMPRLGTKDAIASIHAVPPLAEQKRIVAKVDELLSLCDQLESELKSRSEVAAKFARSVVSAA